jgi:hypothetical protein
MAPTPGPGHPDHVAAAVVIVLVPRRVAREVHGDPAYRLRAHAGHGLAFDSGQTNIRAGGQFMPSRARTERPSRPGASRRLLHAAPQGSHRSWWWRRCVHVDHRARRRCDLGGVGATQLPLGSQRLRRNAHVDHGGGAAMLTRIMVAAPQCSHGSWWRRRNAHVDHRARRRCDLGGVGAPQGSRGS